MGDHFRLFVELQRFEDQEVIDQIDSETHLTIGQIRRHLRENFNLSRVELFYNGRLLRNDQWTLADYGWGLFFRMKISPIFQTL